MIYNKLKKIPLVTAGFYKIEKNVTLSQFLKFW
jgi:hypothetical protein